MSTWRGRLLATTISLAVALGVVAAPAGATHFRGSNFTWVTGAPDQASYGLTVSIRRSWITQVYGIANPSVGDHVAPWSSGNPFAFGDGTRAQPMGTIVAVNEADDFVVIQIGGNPPPAGGGLFTHQFTGDGPFTSTFEDCCTLHTLQNDPDNNYRGETLVDFAHATGSPLTSLSPIVDFGSTGIQRYTIPATDPDGHPLTYRLATTAESAIPSIPAGIAVNSATGELTWNTAGVAPGLYGIAVAIEAHDGTATGPVVGRTIANFLIRVTQTTNDPPAFVAPTLPSGTSFNLVRGQAMHLDLAASDPDSGQVVHIDNLGLPPGATSSSTDGATAHAGFNFTPTELGDYLVTFTAQDDQTPPGSASPVTYTIHVNDRPPVAALAAAPSSGPRDLSVTFDTTGTTDPDGSADLASYTLDYGDGTPAASGTGAPPAHPQHVYTAKGSYTAKLTVTDAAGQSDTASKSITVTNTAPVARLTASPTSGVAPLHVTFDPTGSGDNDGQGDIDHAVLDFGDGTSTTITGAPTATVDHTYATHGSYTARLVVTDRSGAQDTASVSITVADQAPVARLTASPSSGPAPLPVSFSTTGSGDPDGSADVASSTLDFGDGTPVATFTGLPPATTSHTYATAGTYTAKLTITDKDGLKDTASASVVVDRATADLVADPSVLDLSNSALLLPLKPVAHLTRHSNGTGISGATITFRTASSGSVICAGTTDTTGTASCSGLFPVLDTILGLGYRAEFAGNTAFKPATANGVVIRVRLVL